MATIFTVARGNSIRSVVVGGAFIVVETWIWILKLTVATVGVVDITMTHVDDYKIALISLKKLATRSHLVIINEAGPCRRRRQREQGRQQQRQR